MAAGLIKSKYLQTKFHSSRRPSDPCTTPPNQPSHGVCVQANPIVVLNALGYIGFKVVSTCGDTEVRTKTELYNKTQQKCENIFT